MVWDLVENRVRGDSTSLGLRGVPDAGHADRRRGAAARPAHPDHRRDGGRSRVLPGRGRSASAWPARGRRSCRGRVGTLVGGFVIAVVVAAPLWLLAHAIGLAPSADAAHGPQTDFIVQPDIWSFLIALLAGVAGVLALTTSKSGPLVGVFISVTTVPAVGTLALCLGVGVWSEIPPALAQLGVNIAGMVISGTADAAGDAGRLVADPAAAGRVPPVTPMTTARVVPVTTEMDGDELDAEDAWHLSRRIGVRRLLLDSFVRFRYADGFSHSRALAFQAALAVVPFLLALSGLAAAHRPRAARAGAGPHHRELSPGGGSQRRVRDGGRRLRRRARRRHRAGDRAGVLVPVDDHRDGAGRAGHQPDLRHPPRPARRWRSTAGRWC